MRVSAGKRFRAQQQKDIAISKDAFEHSKTIHTKMSAPPSVLSTVKKVTQEKLKGYCENPSKF